MDEQISLDAARHQLTEALSSFQPPAVAPLNISPWIAMSALQKAIRRRHEGLALGAAATLLLNSPERLWRRCGGIAFEDIGVADLTVLSQVTAALAGKRFRATLGGELRVASYIVSQMARATKCRAADDLLMSAELHPTHERARKDFAFRTTPELLNVAASSGSLPEKALALWYAIGTDRRPLRRLYARRGDPNAVFDFLARSGDAHHIVDIAREGFRKVREVLCPFVLLLYPEGQAQTAFVEDDPLPPETMIGDVPGWAYDMYSREGRKALQVFLSRDSMGAAWVRARVPPLSRVDFLGGIVFRIEGGLVRKRLRWPIADELRRLVDIDCHGTNCPDATEILQLMRDDIVLLNKARADVC